MIHSECLHDSFRVFTWFLNRVYMIHSECLQDSFRVFTGFLNWVYMIHSECGFTRFQPMIWFYRIHCVGLQYSYNLNFIFTLHMNFFSGDPTWDSVAMKCEKCPKQSEYNTSFLNRIQHIVSKQSEYIKEDQISNLLMLTEFNTSFF